MKLFKRSIFILLTLTLFGLVPAFAIVIRHDVPDEKYLELGTQYPSFAFFGCGGTLIASNYVLTAAHCGVGKPPASLLIGERQCDIAESIVHPEFSVFAESGTPDFALFRLTSHVRDIEPTKLYRKSDEQGQIVVLVGRGATGTGKDGLPTDEEGDFTEDSQLRGAKQKVDLVTDFVIGFEMNDPASGLALDLEGVSGPDDSGGPAYIETDEGLFVAGVSSYGEWLYGDFDHYARVSAHADWIEKTMKEADALAEQNGTASTGECKKE
jgi:hypothetical protein